MSQPPSHYPPSREPTDPNDRRLQFDTFEPAAGGAVPPGQEQQQQQEDQLPPPGPQMEIDPQRLQAFLDELRWRQSLPLAVLAGAAAAVLGAAAWGGITALTGWRIGLVAVGVGLLVGFAVRKAGKGIDRRFSVVGAVFSLLGCFLGNLLAVCMYLSKDQGIPLADLLPALTNPRFVVELTKASFSPMDLLFYAIAVYEGYRFSLRPLSSEEIAALARPAGPGR